MTSTDTTSRFNISVSYTVMEIICLVPKKTTVWMQTTGDVSNAYRLCQIKTVISYQVCVHII